MPLRNDYVSPSLEALIEGAKSIEEEYPNRANPIRNQLVNLIKIMHQLLENINETKGAQLGFVEIEKSHLEKISLGVWIFCAERIANEYSLLEPMYHKGFFISYGSQLLQLILKKIKVNSLKDINDQQKMIYLEQFYNKCINETSANQYDNINMQDFSVDLQWLKAQMMIVMRQVLKRLSHDTSLILHALPTEESLDSYIDALDDDYHSHEKIMNQSENVKRTFSIQLITAVRQITLNQASEGDRLQRIKMGALLYIMHSINNEYTLRSPNHSELYHLIGTSLNISSLHDLNLGFQLDCLISFWHFLDNQTLNQLERYGRENFECHNQLENIDRKIDWVKKELDQLIQMMGAKNECHWPATKTLSQVGKKVGAIPGYGVGWMLGLFLGQSNQTINAKLKMSDLIKQTSNALVGESGRHWGFLVADVLVKGIFARLFATVMEALCMMLGQAMGGGVGLTLDLSHKGFKRLCHHYLNAYHDLDNKTLIKNCDYEFIRALTELPEEIFSHKNKMKISALLGGKQPQENPPLLLGKP